MVQRDPKSGDVISYRLGRTTGQATVRAVHTDLLATGDRWYLTNGNPRWVSHSDVITN